ncbi:EthD family reductase [Thermoflavimicrobium daqui]|uniref:EthD family reductase n=1 Tax=Thermoflavimicrobium daqui TaxID=2137476 RepID=UPI00143DA2FA|nr:EthD family reductase [Thermoflavimicrobium daqui]
MYKLIVLYKDIIDLESFEQFYYDHHVPRILKLNGIVKVEVTYLFPADEQQQSQTEPNYSLKSEIYFESPEAFEITVNSPEGVELIEEMLEYAGDKMIAYLGKEIVFTK